LTAPLQVIALTFDLDVDADQRILAEVDRIQGRGVLRVLDMVFLAKREDGTLQRLKIGEEEDFGTLLAGIVPGAAAAESGFASDDSPGPAAAPAASGMTRAQALVRSLEPGRAAAFLLVEHLWAGPLVDAAFAAGGALISDDFLTGEAGLAVGSEVTVLEEAAAVIAEAQAAEAEAVLRAVAASAGAAEAEAAAEHIQAAAAADAVSALIAAGLIEEAATQQAVTALTAAGLITGAAAEAASAATARAALTIAAANQAADQAVAEDAATVAAADRAADEAVAEDAALVGAADEVADEATGEARGRVRAASITPSEAEILPYLAEPVPFSIIADKMGISRSAAKERAERLYQRLGVHSRTEAVDRAREYGLLRHRPGER
jgi:DNA-binding NarL/FixJ family response regulator